jgi:hypothetical protein
MEVSLATKECWESQMAGMKASGYTVNDDLTYEDMKKFHDDDRYNISFNREHHISLEMSSFDTILPLLFKRKWTLYRTTEERGLFVTTDAPVLLTFLEPEKIPSIYSPGFGLKKTEIMFPLTKTDLLIGEFENGYGTRDAAVELVALANTKMMYHATERAFMAKRTIRYMALSSEQTWHDAHFMERFVEEDEKLRKQAEAIAKAET